MKDFIIRKDRYGFSDNSVRTWVVDDFDVRELQRIPDLDGAGESVEFQAGLQSEGTYALAAAILMELTGYSRNDIGHVADQCLVNGLAPLLAFLLGDQKWQDCQREPLAEEEICESIRNSIVPQIDHISTRIALPVAHYLIHGADSLNSAQRERTRDEIGLQVGAKLKKLGINDDAARELTGLLFSLGGHNREIFERLGGGEGLAEDRKSGIRI